MSSHTSIIPLCTASGHPILVLHPNAAFTIAEATPSYLTATQTSQEEIVGKSILDVYEADISELKQSLEQVITNKKQHGQNTPVFNEDGTIDFIIHSATDGFAQEVSKPTEQNSTTKDITHQALEAPPNGQQCLYSISQLDEQDLSIPELLEEAVSLLNENWPYPGATVAITFGNEQFASPGYTASREQHFTSKEIGESQALKVHISNREERPTPTAEPFSKEEHILLETITNHLCLKMEHLLLKQEMEENQQLLHKTYQLAHIGSWEYDMQSEELTWSSITKEVHGFGNNYKPDVESTINLFKEGKNRDEFAQAAHDAIEHEKPFDVELKIVSGQGDERWIRATGEPEYNEEGICTRFYGISQNVSDRRQAEEDLQLRERRFKSLVQDGSDLIAILDSEANYKYVSPTSESILGIPAQDFIGTNALDYIHEDDRERLTDLLADLSIDERIQIPPYRFKNVKRQWRWVETTLTNKMEDPAVGGLIANSRDVTKQIQQQQQNLEALQEKETLLSEIHHRVKNNLAVVCGMLQLQVSEEQDEGIKERLFDGIIRIKTMANIHEQLYQSSSFSELEFAKNIQSLILSIQQAFQTKTDISIDFDCAPVQLNINQAIPCSLIVNEVITNVFKHAFPDRKVGNVFIDLSENTDDNRITLALTDNGVGLPEDISPGQSNSLGLNLIDVLSQQLEAEYTYQAVEEGTRFQMTFEKDELKGIGNNFL